MIKTSLLNKRYGELHVLKDVDLHIMPSEIVALMGASGAGKTTLLQIIGTLDKADSGQILINNRDVTKLSDNKLSEFRNKEIGFVFQFHHLLAEFTALENVMLPALIGKQNKKETEERAKELLNIMHLYD
ncbi:MAG: ATP-binding cassette domain-containing protein, partial [Bacteroidales bacterium]|nr:ATP-binding cassette domain-containing protein [Bacteroidales bacterium]